MAMTAELQDNYMAHCQLVAGKPRRTCITHRFVAQVLDATVQVGRLAQQGSDVLGVGLVEVGSCIAGFLQFDAIATDSGGQLGGEGVAAGLAAGLVETAARDTHDGGGTARRTPAGVGCHGAGGFRNCSLAISVISAAIVAASASGDTSGTCDFVFACTRSCAIGYGIITTAHILRFVRVPLGGEH